MVLLIGVVLASAFVNYPICAGRTVLFTQIHTQVVAIEGALLLLAAQKRQRAVLVFLWLASAVGWFHSVGAYARLILTEPAENLRPVLSLIKAEEADAVLVHTCSVAQVRSLPDPLPVSRVVLATEGTSSQPGEKTWVLWTHLGNEDCVRELEQLRTRSRSCRSFTKALDAGSRLLSF